MALQSVNAGDFRGMLFSHPPFAKQSCILPAVDALMVICDHREASLTTVTGARSRRLEDLLCEALEGQIEANA